MGENIPKVRVENEQQKLQKLKNWNLQASKDRARNSEYASLSKSTERNNKRLHGPPGVKISPSLDKKRKSGSKTKLVSNSPTMSPGLPNDDIQDKLDSIIEQDNTAEGMN